VFVDVGFYKDLTDVVQQFGVAQYYATPTVLIVDPSNQALINDEDRHIWSNAYRISMASSVEYFEKWAANDEVSAPVLTPGKMTAQLTQLYAEIDQFEQEQAERVAAGYAVVGPMLAAYENGNAARDFDARWNELRDFRSAIPGDVRELREEAERRVSEGEESVQLTMPKYALMSWESSQKDRQE